MSRSTNSPSSDWSIKDLLRALIFDALVIITVAGAFLAGYLYHRSQTQINFPVLKEAYQVLSEHGLEPLPTVPALEYGMIRGMIEAYNEPYTIFLEPPQNELEANRLSGRYGGIGADIEIDAQGYWLLYPYSEGPAAQAGIRQGDRLIKADALEVVPFTTNEAVLAALRGPVGAHSRIIIGRPPDFAPQEVQITFAEYPLPSVVYRISSDEPRLGIIKVNIIAASTADEIQQAVETLTASGASHFALDLRDNPGGLLDAGVEVARLFLKAGPIMEQQYRGQGVNRYEAEQPGPLADIPLAVLINKGSASAAEIAAGALQAQGRALLIGEPSYGKDTIQLVFPLSDGSSMHVTAARWWIPNQNLETIEGVGIQPDISVPRPPDNTYPDPVIQAVIRSFFGS